MGTENKLSDLDCRNARPDPEGKKDVRLADGGSLFLVIKPYGGKLWHFRYRFGGANPKPFSIGTYPDVSLKEAREKRDEAKKLIERGIDPNQQKKLDKLASKVRVENSFESVAREWHGKHVATWAESTAERNLRLLEVNVFPWLGQRPIAEIKPIELLAVMERAEHRGVLETAHRIRSLAGQVFRYGVARCLCERDTAADLRGALTPRQKENFAAITDPVKFGQLLRDIWAYQGAFATCVAFRLSALFGLRPGELRQLEWADVDTGERAMILIPLGKIKARRMHLVPLSGQAIALLEELRPLTGQGRYCFPGMQNHDRPMSENTINAALRRMGYDTKQEQCAHGFRSSFSTLANGSELWRKEVIEVQLAHKHGNEVELTYNRGDYMKERRRLMQWWSDECDRLRTGAEVIPLRTAS